MMNKAFENGTNVIFYDLSRGDCEGVVVKKERTWATHGIPSEWLYHIRTKEGWVYKITESMVTVKK